MAQENATERDPIGAWTEFLQNSFPTWPAMSQNGVEGQDQWMGMIERLWDNNPFGSLLSDTRTTADTFQRLFLDAASNPGRLTGTYAEFLEKYTRLWADTTLRLWRNDAEAAPVAVPDKADRRFAASDWQQNAIFDAIKQCYLLAATTLLKSASGLEGLDERQQRKLLFYVRQFVDAISPTNFAFTNPEVIHEAIASGGESLVRGTQNMLRDMAAGEIKMTDMDAFAVGRNVAITPGQVVYRNKLMELIQYSPETERVAAMPLVHVPNWINKYYIVDLQPENSLIRYMVQQGFTVFAISWKNPDASMEDVTFDDYMELGPLTAFQVAKEITGAPRVNAIGYCIGGTLLAMTLAYLAAIDDSSVNSATFFVSLLDFTDVGDTAVFVEPANIEFVEEQMRLHGYLDSRQMSLMFNMLRANDLIWSNVVNNYLLGKEAPAFDLLYWNADGTRMTRAAHSFYLRNTYVENNLIKPGKVIMKGVPIDLQRIEQDCYAVGSEQDHLVPWRTAWRVCQLTGGNVRFVVGGSGHIAGVINPPTKGRGYLLNESPADSAQEWFEGAKRFSGSWWPDWVEWLRARSGEPTAPPSMGNETHQPIVAAPGTYVLER